VEEEGATTVTVVTNEPSIEVTSGLVSVTLGVVDVAGLVEVDKEVVEVLLVVEDV
jgi:hypothetical protein